MQRIEFVVSWDAEDSEVQEPLAREAAEATVDIDVRPSTSLLDPASIALIAATALAVGRFVMLWIDKMRGGTVIDLSATPTAIRRDSSVPYLVFIVIAKDGTVKIDAQKEPEDAVTTMISDIFSKALGGLAKQVKEAADHVLGDGKATVTAA